MTEERSPHLPGAGFSPLDHLIRRALIRYGDFNGQTIDGDVQAVFVDFANDIIAAVNRHPYRDNLAPISLYRSATETRPVPDRIILSGLLAEYAKQQVSRDKIQLYVPAYHQAMNEELWSTISGNSKIRICPVDGGARLSESPVTSKITGL